MGGSSGLPINSRTFILFCADRDIAGTRPVFETVPAISGRLATMRRAKAWYEARYAWALCSLGCRWLVLDI